MRSRHIQRCTFKTELLEDVTGVDSLLDYAYMGSAEYEFGALTSSLRSIVTNRVDYEFFDTKIRARDGSSLIVYCNNEKRDQIIESINAIAIGKIRTKDGARLTERLAGKDPMVYCADAWWDIDNDWIAFLRAKRRPLIEKAIECVASNWTSRPTPTVLPSARTR